AASRTSARARSRSRSRTTPGRRRTRSGSSTARRPTTSSRVRSSRRRCAAPPDGSAGARGGRRIAGHDLKSLGGGRHGLLAAAAREGVELTLEHDTMVAAYLLEPQRRASELVERAAAAGIGLAEGVRPEKDEEDDGQLSLGEEGEAGLEPAEEA